MKSLKYFFITALLITLFPSSSLANAELGAEARVGAPFENGINLRRLDLKNKLFKEEIEEKKAELEEAREAFKNASPETRNIMRSEFRAKFAERFKFTLEKITEFQTRVEVQIVIEKNKGTDVSKAEAKLEESKSFMSQIEDDIESLKALLSERYAEDEREAKKEEARILVEKIKTGIRSSHAALKESVRELRLVRAANQNTELSAEAEVETN
ncbi:MAG: hypothetical protein QG654_411 [Patescibacteria group bacterium]|nr:hypothetical protein [Patescibacteria group bacterium]